MRVLLGVFAVVAVVLVFGWFQLDRWSRSEIVLSETVFVVIETGDTLNPISRRLEESGVVTNARLLEILTRAKGLTTLLKKGEYRFEDAVSPLHVLRMVVAGNVSHYFLQIPEGSNFSSVVNILANTPKMLFDLDDVSVDNVIDELGLPIQAKSGEGMFFPDTYRYEYQEGASSILLRAFEVMQQELDNQWSYRGEDVMLGSKYDLLTVASIIERESGDTEDRYRISGVLHRRLAKAMYLQVDPTVIYGLGGEFDGDLTLEHLERPSPYNTYKTKGLPPTPICMPSREALHAAANPTRGDDLYFVARGDGTSQFSRTLEEHNAAVRKYQLE